VLGEKAHQAGAILKRGRDFDQPNFRDVTAAAIVPKARFAKPASEPIRKFLENDSGAQSPTADFSDGLKRRRFDALAQAKARLSFKSVQ
jgi:hypothetical protein